MFVTHAVQLGEQDDRVVDALQVRPFAVMWPKKLSIQAWSVGVRGRLREYWIPAEDLEAFNGAIVGSIEVLAGYRGDPPERVD